MKVIIAGSRSLEGMELVEQAVRESGFIKITEVVSGTACGIDESGQTWAWSKGLGVTGFPAKWAIHGKSAGPIRNREMAAYADALIAIWDGKSAGTRHMIATMRKLGKPTFVLEVKP